jgi:hypothetical protein
MQVQQEPFPKTKSWLRRYAISRLDLAILLHEEGTVRYYCKTDEIRIRDGSEDPKN